MAHIQSTYKYILRDITAYCWLRLGIRFRMPPCGLQTADPAATSDRIHLVNYKTLSSTGRRVQL